MSSVVVYGDTNANIIDGSSIWLMSVCEVLSGIFDDVHLLLKYKPENDRLLQSVNALPNVEVHSPTYYEDGNGLSTGAAATFAEELTRRTKSEAVIVRGLQAAFDFSSKEELQPRLWSYVTDLPFPPSKLSKTNVNRLQQIADHSRKIFAQTEAARSYWEGLVPQAAGKVVLIPPMIPGYAYDDADEKGSDSSDQLRLIYSGKLAKEWRTLEMLELPRALRARGIDATLEVIGAKFDRSRQDPQWVDRMRQALEEADRDSGSGVTWLGALPRIESVARIKRADIGLGWRSSELDSSLELSTKALEYASAGTVPVLNFTDDHQQLLGTEYPFYVASDASADLVADAIIKGLPSLQQARQEVRSVAEYFSMENAKARLNEAFRRAGLLSVEKADTQDKPCRIVVASHDLKFMGELMDYLDCSPEFEVRLDKWSTLHTHDEPTSKELAEWADVVFCEWAGPSLAWYSQNIPQNTALVSRLHRFELNGPWMSKVDWAQVNSIVFVSEWVKRQAMAKFGLQNVDSVVIPNTIDVQDFDRPKSPGAQYTLGLVGMVPFLKRPDRALELLEDLLKVDCRYTLRIKGRMPWEYPHVWSNPLEKQLYLDFFEKIAANELLKRNVVFDGFSADIASWNRGVGFILSPSELESFHLAPAEGMAGGAVPLFWEREGVREVFGRYAERTSASERVLDVLELGDSAVFGSVSSEVRTFAKRWDVSAVIPMWRSLFKSLV
ncbi:hypothetical protein ACUY2X_05305 [Corynebacterium minutissimum]